MICANNTFKQFPKTVYMDQRPRYSVLPQEESSYQKQEDSSQSQTRLNRPWRPSASMIWLCHSALFATSCLMLFYSAVRSTGPTCRSKTAVWSPAYDDLGYDFDTVQFNGSFNSKSIYKGGANPDVDAAWSHIEDGTRAVWWKTRPTL